MIKLFKEHNDSFLSKFALYINYFFAFALILSYLSCHISPEKIWFLALFGLAYPFILVFNIAFFIGWLILGKRHFFISLLVIILGYNHIGQYYQRKGEVIDAENPYSILSFNVHNFSRNYSGLYNKQAQKENFQFIENQNTDIVCIQEFCYSGDNRYASHTQLKNRLGAENYFFESYFKPKKNKVLGMVTYSKFPIVGKGIFEMKGTRKFGIYTDLKIYNDTVRLYNIHLKSIRLNYADYSYVTGINVNDKKYEGNTKQIIGKLKRSSKTRAKQVDILKAHMDNCIFPFIVCGDFNDTPCSYTYQVLANGLSDAFVENGKGLGKTLKGKLPAFRIDYILYDDVFTPLSYDELRINLSDHFPVKSKFIFNKD